MGNPCLFQPVAIGPSYPVIQFGYPNPNSDPNMNADPNYNPIFNPTNLTNPDRKSTLNIPFTLL